MATKNRRRCTDRRKCVLKNELRAERRRAASARRRADRLERERTRDRVTVRVWVRYLAHKRFRAVVAHPHHYATACGLTVFFAATGHFEMAAILGAFGYALVENLFTVEDDK